MNNKLSKYLITLVVLAGLMFAATNYIVSRFSIMVSSILAITLYFLLLFAFSKTIRSFFFEKDPKTKVFINMINIGIKLILNLFCILTFFLAFNGLTIPFVIVFFSYYLIFTIFDVTSDFIW